MLSVFDLIVLKTVICHVRYDFVVRFSASIISIICSQEYHVFKSYLDEFICEATLNQFQTQQMLDAISMSKSSDYGKLIKNQETVLSGASSFVVGLNKRSRKKHSRS